MEEKTPTVSVVIATFNGEKYIREQLSSILSQTYPLLEILVQDDGSSDNTMQILQEYAAKDNKIKVFVNEGEHGVNGNFYSLMRRAKGDFIAISDQDDIWMADKIEREVKALADGKALCGGRSVPFSEDGVSAISDSRKPNTGILRLIFSAEIPGHTMLIRREWLATLPWSCRIFKERMYDYVLSVAAATNDKLVWINGPLVRQRRYAAAATYTSIDTSVPSWRNGINMLCWCLRHYVQVKRECSHLYQSIEQLVSSCAAKPVSKTNKDAIQMLRLQQSAGLTDFFKFQYLCLKHRNEILHVSNRSLKNLLHAAFFPILSCWYSRVKIKE